MGKGWIRHRAFTQSQLPAEHVSSSQEKVQTSPCAPHQVVQAAASHLDQTRHPLQSIMEEPQYLY